MTTNTKSELDAIRTGAAIYPLTDRAFLRITGSDATRWLNGMVTNNIAALASGEGNYNFLLNAQGRIQGDCTIYREPGDGPATYLLETDKAQIETIHQLLDKFIIMDDVELAPTLAESIPLLLIGPDAHAIVQALGYTQMQPGRMISSQQFDSSILLTPVTTLLATPRYEFHSSPSGISDLIEALKLNPLPQLSPEAIEAHRILSAVPKFGVDITEKYLPQETAQTHALHFSKGCYLGQEIVERIHSRGQVHRIFTQFTLTGEMPQLPASIESSGKPAGELTSAALVDGTLYALGYARREFMETNQPLSYAGGTATPKLTTGS